MGHTRLARRGVICENARTGPQRVRPVISKEGQHLGDRVMALPSCNRPLEGQHLRDEGRLRLPGVSMYCARQRAGSAIEPAGKCSTTSGLAKVTQLKQGGRVHTPYSKVGGWGAAVSRDAQPNLFRCCFTTVPNLGRPKTTPGVHAQTDCNDVWGEWNRTTPERGVSRRASGNLADEGDAIPSRPASPHRSAKHVSDRTTGEWSTARWSAGRMDTAQGQRTATRRRSSDEPSDMRPAAPTSM